MAVYKAVKLKQKKAVVCLCRLC